MKTELAEHSLEQHYETTAVFQKSALVLRFHSLHHPTTTKSEPWRWSTLTQAGLERKLGQVMCRTKGADFTDRALALLPHQGPAIRKKTKICKQSFVHKCLLVTWKHFQRTVGSLCRWQIPLAFSLNLFGIVDTQICPFDRYCWWSLYCIYSRNLPQLSKSVRLGAMAYLGLCFWITSETRNSVKNPNRWQS